jgi:hypothetical protein
MTGPHLSASGAKSKREGDWLGRWRGELGHVGRLRMLAGEGGRQPSSFWAGKRKKRRSGLGGLKVERGKGRRGLGFLFLNHFQIRFSNFQTSLKHKNPAFES